MTKIKEETWEAHRTDWLRSGKSKRAYTEEKGISLSSFTRWLKKLPEEKGPRQGFVSLRMPEKIWPLGETMQIRGTGRVWLGVPLAIDLGRLRELITLMETAV